MVPAPVNSPARPTRLLSTLATVIVQYAPKLFRTLIGNSAATDHSSHVSTFHKRAEAHGGKKIAFAILIPVLVLLSGLFAGLTLGYMSLDETQLHVLSISGTP